jgi:DNA (cytosine-5)-methyltransferase 1
MSDACKTLKQNRPHWNVIEGDVAQLDFTPYKGKIDLVSGGFPCQAFSYAGQRAGFDDARGTLFFQWARVIRETQPSLFLGENVRGLLTHDNGKTISVIKSVIKELGYTLVEPQVLRAIFYRVPQKRERLILIGVRNDLLPYFSFEWPKKAQRIYTLRDALRSGELYKTDVPESDGQKYPKRKGEILAMVPPGGYWRDLPLKIQREYMKGSFHLAGGKTGMARRLSWDAPSLTLTCAPAQTQTERCHPEENRPLTVREYARIQTFPDDWQFAGSTMMQYKQIGNAVPVNLAEAVGRSLVRALNYIEAHRSPKGRRSRICKSTDADNR